MQGNIRMQSLLQVRSLFGYLEVWGDGDNMDTNMDILGRKNGMLCVGYFQDMKFDGHEV